jgi:hypothetical protein
MKWVIQAIQFRWYIGHWPIRKKTQLVWVDGNPDNLLAGRLVVYDEINWGRKEIDEYIDPVIHEEINAFLADVLG